MSAVMAIVERDCIHVISDAAFYDQDGVLTATMPKILPLPGANAVFASRGPAAAYLAFQAAVEESEYYGFDGFRRQFERIAARCDELLEGEPFELIVAGWSEEYGCGQVLFRETHGKSRHSTTPGVCYLMADRSGFGVDIAHRWDRGEVLAKFEKARAFADDLTCGRSDQPIMGFSVGGYVWSAIVRPDAWPTFEVLRTWPDELGEKINSRPALAAAA